MKVRAKDLSGKWIYGVSVTADKTRLLMSDDSFTPVDTKTICEFSNCFDSNGDEIYAGDIIQEPDGEFLLVYNCCGRFITGIPTFVKVYQLYDDDLDNARGIKIVGNIIDNPDFFDNLPPLAEG